MISNEQDDWKVRRTKHCTVYTGSAVRLKGKIIDLGLNHEAADVLFDQQCSGVPTCEGSQSTCKGSQGVPPRWRRTFIE